MKIYTRTGDDGMTHLLGGVRVTKADSHIEARGTVDELNSWLGLTRAEPLPIDMDKLLCRLQHELFEVGADLSNAGSEEARCIGIDNRQVDQLEREIDRFEASLPPLGEFVLPGGVRSAALLHVARTTCRRAERRVVSLQMTGGDDCRLNGVTRYLNRLGDLLFVLTRVLNARANCSDERWR